MVGVGVGVETAVDAAGKTKRRTFRKFTYRGVDLEALLDMSTDDLVRLLDARGRRKFKRGLNRKALALMMKLRKAVNFSATLLLVLWIYCSLLLPLC